MTACTLLDEEARIFAPPSRLTPSEWSSRHRILPVGAAAHPGPWDPRITPYACEVLDAVLDPYCHEITAVFGAQSGKSTIGENLVGWIVSECPGPVIWVMPREGDYHHVHGARIVPMIQHSTELAKHLTGRVDDVTQEWVQFDRCRLMYANAKSTIALKGKTARFAIVDEIDEMPSTAQGDPVEIVRQRLNTYGDRARLFASSTPTFESGKIWQRWLRSDQRRFWLPCPACGGWQVLEWEFVRWDGGLEDVERACETARYECPKCQAAIDDADRWRAVQLGKWVQARATIDDRGEIHGATPARHRGYHLSSLYSCTMTLGQLVGRALGGDFADFVRQNLALPYEVQTEAVQKDELEACIDESLEPGTVPETAQLITAGVDVQGAKLGFFYVVRAWAPDGESWLVKAGRARTWQGVEEATVRATYGERKVAFTFVDSGDGNRDDEVYDFCRGRGLVVAPSKGRAHQAAPLMPTTVDRNPVTGATFRGGLQLWQLHTLFLKDWLVASIKGGRAPWHLHQDREGMLGEYLQHMRSEQRVVRDTRAYWVKKPGRNRNDFFDCEALALAAWYRLTHVGQSKALRDRRASAGTSQSEQAEARRQANTERQRGWLGQRRGRRGRGGGGWIR